MDAEAERLVAALNNLTDGESVVTALVALGPKAIDPLRHFLITGRPSTVYQPRRWAVQALGGLNAKAVLVEYLTSLPPVHDPQLRFAEEAVQNAAIREFLRWPDSETVALLLDLSKHKMLTALVEALGSMRLVEAIPYLERALQDDICRLPAEAALVEIGEPARNALILSAATKLPADDAETPSGLRRRQSVLRVLGEIGIRFQDWLRLFPLTWEANSEIVVRSCALAVGAGILNDRQGVIARLIAVAGEAPWFLQEDIEECLLACFETARPDIEAEIAHRIMAPDIDRARDQCLRVMLRVMRRHG
jgi:hypothetical protein